jgi:hypothetical protein
MEFESLSETVKKALEHYDNQNWNNKKMVDNQDVKFDELNSTITFFINDTSKIYNYELLGYYDNQNGVWIWGWVLSDFNYKDTPQCKYLLDYGLKLEPKSATIEQTMIKGILVNSRIKIEEQTQLDVNLALYSYLIKDRIKFIYGRKRYIDKTLDSYVTFYYLIK